VTRSVQRRTGSLGHRTHIAVPPRPSPTTAQLAPLALDREPVAVALAANEAFRLVANFFDSFDTPVPGEVFGG